MSRSGERKQVAADPSLLHTVTRACRSAFVTVGAFSFCINLLILTVPIYMVQLFDRVMTSRSEDTLLVLTIAAVAAFTVMATLDLIRSRMLVRIGLWLDGKLSPALFVATLAPAAGAGRSTRCLRDLSQVRTFLTGAGVLTLMDAPWVPLFIGLIFILHPLLGLAAVVGGGLMMGLALLNEVLTRAPLRDANAAAFRGMTAVESMVRQAETAEGMGMGKTLSAWWSTENARALRFQAVASDRAGLVMALSKFVRLVLQVLILGLAALLVVRQELSVGAMIAASIILSRALAPVEQSIGVWRSLVIARMSFRRVKDTLLRAAAESSQMLLPKPAGKLVVSTLAFIPEGLDEPVFSGLSFQVNPGELLGVTGPTGAGKSTLVRLLLGVAKPARGTVRLDGADVFTWNADDLGRHVGYVPQVVELLPGTVRDNIARFSDAPPCQVVEAAKRAGIHELILQFPEGYDTVVGGPADRLSVGTRQRVALARALFGDPTLVILDEPYSNLDADGVGALIGAIHGLKARGATTIIVAHRPSILAHAERVLLLQDGCGKIVKKGARTNLRVFSGADKPAGKPGADDAARSVA